MNKIINVEFNHYRGEGGTPEEITRDWGISAKHNVHTTHGGRRSYTTLELQGNREDVMAFLDDYALAHLVEDVEPMTGPDDNVDYYDDDDQDDA